MYSGQPTPLQFNSEFPSRMVLLFVRQMQQIREQLFFPGKSVPARARRLFPLLVVPGRTNIYRVADKLPRM